MYNTVQSFIIRLLSLNDIFLTVYVKNGSQKKLSECQKVTGSDKSPKR